MTSSNGNIFPRYWPFVRGIHRSPVNSPHKGQWRGALMFSLICTWTNSWVNNRDAGALRRHRAHYDATVMNGEREFPKTMIKKNFWGKKISNNTYPSWNLRPAKFAFQKSRSIDKISSFIFFSHGVKIFINVSLSVGQLVEMTFHREISAFEKKGRSVHHKNTCNCRSCQVMRPVYSWCVHSTCLRNKKYQHFNEDLLIISGIKTYLSDMSTRCSKLSL